MKKNKLLLSLLFLLLLYPAISLYNLEELTGAGAGLDLIENSLKHYQLSIWISWIVMAIVSVYYKWNTKNNFFFYFTYIFLLVSSVLLGYYFQMMVNYFNVATPFRDNYTFGVLKALQNFVVAAVITAFLQVSVWWFTRRWHRQ